MNTNSPGCAAVSIADVRQVAELTIGELRTACETQAVKSYRLPGRPSGWLIVKSDLVRFLKAAGAMTSAAAKLAA